MSTLLRYRITRAASIGAIAVAALVATGCSAPAATSGADTASAAAAAVIDCPQSVLDFYDTQVASSSDETDGFDQVGAESLTQFDLPTAILDGAERTCLLSVHYGGSAEPRLIGILLGGASDHNASVGTALVADGWTLVPAPTSQYFQSIDEYAAPTGSGVVYVASGWYPQFATALGLDGADNPTFVVSAQSTDPSPFEQ